MWKKIKLNLSIVILFNEDVDEDEGRCLLGNEWQYKSVFALCTYFIQLGVIWQIWHFALESHN